MGCMDLLKGMFDGIFDKELPMFNRFLSLMSLITPIIFVIICIGIICASIGITIVNNLLICVPILIAISIIIPICYYFYKKTHRLG